MSGMFLCIFCIQYHDWLFFITGAVATPSGETKEFTFAAPPVSHTIPTLATSGSFHYVDLYLKASTAGARGVEVKASYNGNKVLANTDNSRLIQTHLRRPQPPPHNNPNTTNAK